MLRSQCCVVGCPNIGGKDFFPFPALERKTKELEELSRKRRTAWLLAIRRTDLKVVTFLYKRKICPNHFISGCPAQLTEESDPDWVPTLNMGYDKILVKKKPSRITIEEHKYAIEVAKADSFSEMEQLQLELDEKDEIIKQYTMEKLRSEKEQQEIIENYKQKLKEKESEIEAATQQINILKGLASLEYNNDKVKYLTGLPNFAVLDHLFNSLDVVRTNWPEHISNFEAFILTLTKLRLDLPFNYLAYKYGVSYGTVVQIFQANIVMLHAKIQKFIEWPDKSELQLNTPPDFKTALGNRFTAIIHYFDLLVETAGALPRAEMSSSSEWYSTIRYMIAISPTGTIMFVSKGYSGKCTDKIIVTTSGFLENVEQGDIVLFGTEMRLVNEVAVHKGKKLLVHPIKMTEDGKVDYTTKPRNMAVIKQRVERIIGLLQETYKILAHRQPIAVYKTENDVICIDYIVETCCALVNSSLSITYIST